MECAQAVTECFLKCCGMYIDRMCSSGPLQCRMLFGFFLPTLTRLAWSSKCAQVVIQQPTVNAVSHMYTGLLKYVTGFETEPSPTLSHHVDGFHISACHLGLAPSSFCCVGQASPICKAPPLPPPRPPWGYVSAMSATTLTTSKAAGAHLGLGTTHFSCSVTPPFLQDPHPASLPPNTPLPPIETPLTGMQPCHDLSADIDCSTQTITEHVTRSRRQKGEKHVVKMIVCSNNNNV